MTKTLQQAYAELKDYAADLQSQREVAIMCYDFDAVESLDDALCHLAEDLAEIEAQLQPSK